MLDIKFIRENKDIVQSAIKNKKGEDVDLDRVVQLYDELKELRGKVDRLNAERNRAAKDRDVEKGRGAREALQDEEKKLREVMDEFKSLMIKIPNVPSADTPIGPDESGNKVIREIGERTKFEFKPKDHLDLGKALDVIDNDRAAKVSGARFTFLKGDLVHLQFALLKYVFEVLGSTKILGDVANKANLDIPITPFTPVLPPDMIKPQMLNAMGRLEPKEERYYIESDNLYLIGSAEHPLGAMHADEIFSEDELPIRYIGYSSAFRREAGSYGKDTRGILRLHQFDKAEMETFCLPEQAVAEQDFLVAIQEYLMQSLNIPYRVVIICTGDMGMPDQRQIDIEAWMPGEDKYRETHTSDLIGGFQPRRLNTKVRRSSGASEYVAMNDATAFAAGRTLIAIMENFQNEDGSIDIPKVLQKYTGKDVIKKI